MSESIISDRDESILEALPLIVSNILGRYSRYYSSLKESLDNEEGNCLAFMKWGGGFSCS